MLHIFAIFLTKMGVCKGVFAFVIGLALCKNESVMCLYFLNG